MTPLWGFVLEQNITQETPITIDLPIIFQDKQIE